MKTIKYTEIHTCVRTIAGLFLVLLNSCSDAWLEPKPLSFYTPENTYVDAEGFDAALAACEKIMFNEYNGDGMPSLTEMVLSDIAVEGTTDKAGPQMDIDKCPMQTSTAVILPG
jgi:hypothetical protein